MRELYELCRRKFQSKFSIGRDQCYNLFRSNGLCQRYRKRPRTTFSNHNYFIFGDLLNTTPKLKPSYFGQLCVADITYVATQQGWAYLSLVTDAASRVIVGWQLHSTLSKDGPIEAMKKAIDFYRVNHVNLTGLIHHSDRGTQYCCNEYIALLEDHGIRASMTQTGDPLHNALAERINNTVKNGWLFETQEKSFEEVKQLVQKAVDIYNRVRSPSKFRNEDTARRNETLIRTSSIIECLSGATRPLPTAPSRCFSFPKQPPQNNVENQIN